MNNFLRKKKITICGAGGGSPSQPPPPNVSQYPSVLAPPQFSKVNSISSFSYAEMIDLISDGPIEGLVNKNGKKVYDENIFEAIYLNDTPIKETSTENKQNISIEFLKEKLKRHFKFKNNKEDFLLFQSEERKTIIYDNEIDDENFKGDVSIISYHPNDSVFQFVKSIEASFDSISLIQKAFDLSPIINEKPFLTKISIPKLILNLPKDRFDINEGGVDSPSPLKIGVIDLSNYIYFSIGSETLNSFNYFELPRTFVNNNSLTNAGKKTFKKNLLSTDNFYSYEAYDIDIYIWSIYNEEVGIKDIDIVLDKYFKNIYIFQNNFSLFNYNLVQSEFKNGSEIQAPLKYFNNVEIDTEYGKELIGPFKVSGDFSPSNALDAGGVQRIRSFTETFSYRSPLLSVANIENETSDDIRYVKSWPIEYNCQGGPFIICKAVLNYSQFDKTTASRVKQDAVPITHYISNENVEEVYVTINIDRLYDTNHVDLVTSNADVFGANKQSKIGQADELSRDIGINSYSDLLGYSTNFGYTSGNIYFLTYGKSSTDAYVIDGVKTTGALLDDSLLICNLKRVTNKLVPSTLYYNTISSEGLGSKVPNIQNLIGLNNNADPLYQASIENCLLRYQIPNDSYLIKESFSMSSFKDTLGLEARLKLLNEDQSPFYCFGLAQTESIISSVISDYIPNTATSNVLTNTTKEANHSFFVSRVAYRTASPNELSEKAVVAHVINNYIDWNSLIDKTKTTAWTAKQDLLESVYPNVFNYIINPYLRLNTLEYGNIFPFYKESVIGNLYLIGINGAYLRSQPSFFEGSTSFLKIDILDQLLEEFLLKTDQSSNFTNIDVNNGINYISDFSTTRALENSLIKFENGKLIGNSSVFNFKKYTPNNVPLFAFVNDPAKADRNVTNEARSLYVSKNIFLYRSQYASINSNDKNTTLVGQGGRDFIFFYNLYSNINLNTSEIKKNSGVEFYGTNVQSDGSQPKYSINADNLSKVRQTITAGTKLPAVVSIDVETGYESKEEEQYRAACEYFSYRYNVYGISNEGASIDLGRKSYDFVSACKTSLDRGGYVSFFRNVYFDDYPIYLFELICSGASTLKTGYYLSNIKDLSLGEMDLNSLKEDANFQISYINTGNSNIGVCQKYISGLNIIENGVNTTILNESGRINFVCDLLSSSTRLNSLVELPVNEIPNLFNENLKVLDVAKATAFLKNNSNKIIPSYLDPVDAYACSQSVDPNNINYYDRYEYVDTDLDFKRLILNIYNYNACFYQSVYVDPNWVAGTITSRGVSNNYLNYSPFNTSSQNIAAINKTVNMYIFIEPYSLGVLHPGSVFYALKKYIKSNIDYLVLQLEGFTVLFKNGSALIDVPSFLKAAYSGHVGLPSSSIGITETISAAPIDSKIQNELILNIDLITAELNKKFSYGNEAIITSENLISAIKNISSIKETYLTSQNRRAGIFGALITKLKTINSTYIGQFFLYQTTLKISDKRFALQNLFPSNPIIVNANFWCIFNKFTGQIVIIFKPTTEQNQFLELEEEITFLNFSTLMSANYNDPLTPDAGPMNYRIDNESNYNNTRVIAQYFGSTYFYYKNNGSTNFPTNTFVTVKPRNDAYAFAYRPLGGELQEVYPYYTSSNNAASDSAYQYSTFAYDTNSFEIPFKSRSSDDPHQRVWNMCLPHWRPSLSSYNGQTFLRCYSWNGAQNAYDEFELIFNPSRDRLVTFHNPETNTNTQYCYWTNYFRNTTYKDPSLSPFPLYNPPQNWLLEVEKAFLKSGVIKSDMRMETSQDVPILADKNFRFLEVRYYAGVTISNTLNQTNNTLANDAGLRIQIPKPKKDKYGNPLRRYVKVTRKSHETLSVLISKKISLSKVTEIIPQKFSYPFSSIVGTKIDARAFSQIPNRTFLCKLKKVLVPSNYFPNNENEDDVRYIQDGKKYKIYDGDWDGTFKLAWSNNPAWIMLDLLINKRYGLGNYIESEQVDIWELYKIARWCDCVDDNGYYYGVSDGFGGIEPRHSFNGLISDKFNIFDMINQVASVFRGHVYYMNSLITFDDDRIKPIIGEFNNSEVKDGLFSYTNHKKDDEFTAVDVAYIDARDNYKPKIEYVEDSDGIRQRGILKKQINTFGITSTAQARRFGKYFLYQTSKENSTVSFTTDSRALLYKPGDLIKINDELMNSIKNYGEIKEVSDIDKDSFKITIDKILDSGLYNTGEITLYSPISKPKYDDFYANAQFVPENLIFCTSSPILGSTKETLSGLILGENNFSYNGVYSRSINTPFTEFKMNAFDTTNPVKSFSGVSNVRYKIEPQNSSNIGYVNCSITGFLTYIQNININNEPAKFGHWEFSTTYGSFNKDKLIFDIVQNESIKYQLPYKNYFFEYFDTGRYLRYSGVNQLTQSIYNTIDFDPTENYTWANLPNDSNHTGVVISPSINKFTISNYKKPSISYFDIIENDRPSIDTFEILNYTTGDYIVNNEVYNEYTEITLSKKNYNPFSFESSSFKTSVSPDINKIQPGFPYSLIINNNKPKIYKVSSMSENYINEYNILATEYSLDKFKDIEDNYEIDNLKNTFNFLTAHTEAKNVLDSLSIQAPIIKSLVYISNIKAIEIEWTSVANANNYEIYMQTPSKQTNNFIAKANYNEDFNQQTNSYKKIWYLPSNSEIGTYTISIQAFLIDGNRTDSLPSSPIASRSINIMTY
jgi:hypothetical protein